MSRQAATTPLSDQSSPYHSHWIMKPSSALDHKSEWILKREWEFAHKAALRVVDKPELSVWMILIPIIFLHFMHRAQKFKSGLGAITRELFGSRELALKLARDSIIAGTGAPDPAEHLPPDDGSDTIRELRQAELQLSRLLIEHYRKLLSADGKDYEALVREAYGDAAGYRAYLDQLGEAEGWVASHARQAAADRIEAEQVLDRIGAARDEFRAEDLRACFPGPDPG